MSIRLNAGKNSKPKPSKAKPAGAKGRNKVVRQGQAKPAAKGRGKVVRATGKGGKKPAVRQRARPPPGGVTAKYRKPKGERNSARVRTQFLEQLKEQLEKE